MSRLIVVSNRVACHDQKSVGGLASALHASLREFGGIWFGWSGECAESNALHQQPSDQENLSFVTMDLTPDQYHHYYCEFSNRTLWPLLHMRTDIAQYDTGAYRRYREVNRLFAERIAEFLQPDDLIWVHDYHLIPLASELRKLGVQQRIGFFLHIPLVPMDCLQGLPIWKELFATLAEYNVVGVQCKRDLRALQELMTDAFGSTWRPQSRKLVHPASLSVNRDTAIDAFPISIDTARLERIAEAQAQSVEVQNLVRSLDGRPLVLGVDRLDYSKGLPARFRAVERFLKAHHERLGDVSFLQIAPTTREDIQEYQQLRTVVNQLVGQINGEFGKPDWVPLRYVNDSFSQETLCGYYRCARVGLVTPLRDGMNLVAKEFIASQDPADPGVLILSRFAGAAEQLVDALLVNPSDEQEVAEAIEQALSMPLAERQKRFQKLINQIETSDIQHWRARFMKTLVGKVLVDPGQGGGYVELVDHSYRRAL